MRLVAAGFFALAGVATLILLCLDFNSTIVLIASDLIIVVTAWIVSVQLIYADHAARETKRALPLGGIIHTELSRREEVYTRNITLALGALVVTCLIMTGVELLMGYSLPRELTAVPIYVGTALTLITGAIVLIIRMAFLLRRYCCPHVEHEIYQHLENI